MSFFEQLKKRKSEFNSFRQDAISSNLSLIKGGSNTDEVKALYCKQPCGPQMRPTPVAALYCKQPCGPQMRPTPEA